jgi:tRNA modification GTPase
MSGDTDTICAIATPAGKGGVSIIRVSGPEACSYAEKLLGFSPQPRYAHYGSFFSPTKEIIDTGIALFFPAPNSFTGEDILELQAHGGPFLVDLILTEVLSFGARLARPGEFSERAFLNNKIDLTQAEAIADLIDSNSIQASKHAMRSLQGEFSKLINILVSSIIELRVYVEAAIDFPEEDIDFLNTGNVQETLSTIQQKLDKVLSQARQGSLIKEGLRVVIAGEPNAGKSSLLNALAGQSSAIVTEVAGTTRDTLKEHINIDGMPLHVIDTAGLRISDDIVEREGIKRAWEEIHNADQILLIVDSTKTTPVHKSEIWKQLKTALSDLSHLSVIKNKIDLSNLSPELTKNDKTGLTTITLSAKQKNGIELLQQHLKKCAGFMASEEGGFIARRRHLDALQRGQSALRNAMEQLCSHKAGELVAEDLRAAHEALAEITGEFTSDDLLGEIFSSFCIGK